MYLNNLIFPNSIQLRIHCLVLFLSMLVLASPAAAHEIRPAITDVVIKQNSTYELSYRINLEALLAGIGEEHADTDESANAEMYNNLRLLDSKALEQQWMSFLPSFVEKIQVRVNDERVTPKYTAITIPEVGDTDISRTSTLLFAGNLSSENARLSIGWDKTFGKQILRVSNVAGEDLYTAYLDAGQFSVEVGLTGDIVNNKQHWSSVFYNYLVIGFTHIIPKGLDHILFVIGLFLLAAGMRSLVLQVTSFTVAHSVTLALGILGIVQIPASIVEPIIALSIVYVGVENIFSQKLQKWRPPIIFLFGLLHGFGFAGVLGEIGLTTGSFITSLVAFNVGVEFGQLAVIAICFMTVGFWFSSKSWYRQVVTIPGSLLIAVMGAYWFIERTFL